MGIFPMKMGLSENVRYIPNEIAIFHRDNDRQNHWVQWGTLFSDTPIWISMYPLDITTMENRHAIFMGKSTISMAIFNSFLDIIT